ncbi:MAG: DUF2905 domain-containing protein [Terriglobales bacterium]
MATLGRGLVVFGLLLAAGGVVLLALARAHVPPGHWPGDFVHRGNQVTVYFPWVTMIVVSVVLTVVLNLIFRR